MTLPLTLDRLNALPADEALAALDGVYGHAPWIAERALARRPFATLVQLKLTLVEAVRDAGRDRQLALLRAHPELDARAGADDAAGAAGATAHAGPDADAPDARAALRELNAAYRQRFGWSFVLATRGPRGTGLSRDEIVAAFERRLAGQPEAEFAEGLRQLHRIAEQRLDDRFGFEPVLGRQVWDWAEALAVHSDPGWAERGQLTVTYATAAHRAVAAQLRDWMTQCGFDEVSIDAVGNVVGLYHASDEPAWAAHAGRRLLAGSHYDTVRNAGRFDGRLGILVPMVCVRELHRAGRRLPFGVEVVGFAEEEGQRFPASFLGSPALAGSFDPAWLAQTDADGTTLADAMRAAGLPGTMEAIAALRRDPSRYLGFVEAHIEQGPVLTESDLPLGVVTSIHGAVRLVGEMTGVACHAGATPMARRHDAAMAAAELGLYAERRAAEEADLVATMGLLEVPGGSINVVPGRCTFGLDIRAAGDDARDECVADVLQEIELICERRGVGRRIEETMRVAAAPCAPAWQERWMRAVGRTGLPVLRLPSGAGHDAMILHQVMPQGMLFVRGGNGGISHNPLESVTDDDAQLCVEACAALLDQLAEDLAAGRHVETAPEAATADDTSTAGGAPAGSGDGAAA